MKTKRLAELVRMEEGNFAFWGGIKSSHTNSFAPPPPTQITGADAPIRLPYEDSSFDVVTCVVSVDYLKRPVEVISEVNRVLKPGGKVIFSQSNRFFPSKVVNIWLNLTDEQRLELIEGYLTWAGGFEKIDCWDITPGGGNDPMWIVEAKKQV